MKMIDWSSLTFGYTKTDYNIRCSFTNGSWGELREETSEYVSVHMSASALHYGQEAFEGLKAFRGKDGKIRVFRMRENALRLIASCEGIMMEPLPVELFEEAIKRVVELNKDYIPPYGSGASLYLRPVLFGSSALLGVKPAKDYEFIVFASPVGPYFKEGIKPTSIAIMPEYDRVAPNGTGRFKIGGNYAASLQALERCHELGYSTVLYLDSKYKKFIDECGPANFFGIKHDTYITPKSKSILPSITNKSLMQIAEDLGMTVEHRQIAEDELSTFEEAGACGTAAVISPISRIDDLSTDQSYIYSTDNSVGPWSLKLYKHLQGIQYGEIPDTHNWNTIID